MYAGGKAREWTEEKIHSRQSFTGIQSIINVWYYYRYTHVTFFL